MDRSLSSSISIVLSGLLAVAPVYGYGQSGASVQAAGSGAAGQKTVQVASSTQPPVVSTNGAGTGETNAQVMTLHTSTNLVVLDVVVTDGKGNPIHGLQKSDFTLSEAGRAQTIKSFEEHTALSADEAAKAAAPAQKKVAGVFSNQQLAPSNGPVNVILIDYLNTPLTAQPQAKQQLIEYLNKAPKGTRMAIFGMNTALLMLQGFTSDPEVLKNALESKKATAQASNILNDPMNGGLNGGNTALADNLIPDGIQGAQQIANVARFQALENSFEQDVRVKATLASFNQLARYLSGIPGRKNLIWFSGSFPLAIEPDVTLQDAFDSVVRNDDEMRRTENLLMKAQVAVYPVDVRGVFSNPANSVITSAPSGTAQGGSPSLGGSSSSFAEQTAQEQLTMQQVAEDTGGHAYINTNDLTTAVKQAVESGSSYYTLTYSPNNLVWDGRFRAFKVAVAEHPGVKLSYRNGYYADDPNDRNKLVAGSSAMATQKPTTMISAMIHGAPEGSEILFKMRVRPSSAPEGDTALTQNKTNPNVKLGGGPYKNYGIDMVPDAKSISCPVQEDGQMHCWIEAATYVYNSQGELLVTNNWNAKYTLSQDDYQRLLASGMALHQAVSVPVKDGSYIRVAIHDLNSDRVGSSEVPVATVKNLPPLDAAPVSASAAEPATAAPATGTAPATAAPKPN